MATETDSPAPGARPSPSALWLVLSPAPTPSIQSPIHLQRPGGARESLKQGWGAGGHPQLSFPHLPTPPPDNGHGTLAEGRRGTGNFLGIQGPPGTLAPRPLSPAPGALRPTPGTDGMERAPNSHALGFEGWGPARKLVRGGAGATRRPPDTPPRVPPVPRADLRHHHARSPDMTPSPDPRRPPYLPACAPRAGGSGRTGRGDQGA